MTVFIDLIGSTIVRTAMVVIMIVITATMSEALYRSSVKQSTAENLATIQQVMQSDMKRMVPNSIDAWRTNQYRITFWAYKDSTMTSSHRVAYVFSKGKLYRSVDFKYYAMANNLVVNNSGLFTYTQNRINTKLCAAIVSSTDTTYVNNSFDVNL